MSILHKLFHIFNYKWLMHILFSVMLMGGKFKSINFNYNHMNSLNNLHCIDIDKFNFNVWCPSIELHCIRKQKHFV